MKVNWDKKFLECIWGERMTLCYKMLLIKEMMDHADEQGSLALRVLAKQFKAFFEERRAAGKIEDNPNRFKRGEALLSERSIEDWERNILSEPVAHLKSLPLEVDGSIIRWSPEYWQRWSPGFRRAVRNTAEVRLIEYFDRSVPGGF
jgi:hypothetical protein